MTSKQLELKLNSELLNYNFEGYKLSLQTLSSTKHEFDIPVNRKCIDSNQYSFLHAKVFGLHNFLFTETTNEYENVYYVDNEKNILKGSLNPYSLDLTLTKVWEIPSEETTTTSDDNYNTTIKFISENLVLVADGKSTLYILETNDRRLDIPWKLLHSVEIIENKSFYIQDAVLKDNLIHLLLCRIQQNDKKTELEINWITISINTWKKTCWRKLICRGNIGYIYFEKNCEAIYVSSSSGCKFTYDSENPIVQLNPKESVNLEKGYKWSQDDENIIIHFIVQENSKKENINITNVEENLEIKCEDSVLLTGTLYDKIDNDLTTYTLNKNLLEISFVKQEKDKKWLSLLQEVDADQEIKDNLAHLTSESEENPGQGLTFNTENVEECDFTNSELIIFERLCAKTHLVTHRYNFGSNEILLITNTDNNSPPSFGIRNDVDICIFQPNYEEDFQLKHISTLLALGYVQASKQQKKFITSPSDFSYSLICETVRHMFLYRHKNVESGELKNRKTGVRIGSIAEQKVITIPNEEVLGIHSTPNGVYLLIENSLIYFKC